MVTAKAAQQALRRSWCAGEPEKLPITSKGRFQRLYDLLRSGKMEVKVLPDQAFGLIHGKAGVIRYRDGRKTCFMGSTIYAGRQTTEKMLTEWGNEDRLGNAALSEDDENSTDQGAKSNMKDLTAVEREELNRCLKALEANQDRDPKYQNVLEYLVSKDWLGLGCIVFSQYFDSIWWLAQQLSYDLKDEPIGIYAGGANSGIMFNEQFRRTPRDEIKRMIGAGETRLLLGTDAASEGLNLQRLGSLINLDLPWNPTRLEQRKGRIQRIGQIRDEVYVYNMRYKGSVEDRS